MDKILGLSHWNFPERVNVPDGYDTKSVPDNTRANMEVLINKINELVKVVNQLIPKDDL